MVVPEARELTEWEWVLAAGDAKRRSARRLRRATAAG